MAKTLADVVDKLVENAYKILNWKYIAATAGTEVGLEKQPKGLPEGYENYDHIKLEAILRMAEPLLKDAQATRKLEAQSSNEIIKLIGKGKVSLADAIKLMSLMKIKLEVEEQEAKKKLQDKMFEIINSKEE